MSQPNTLIPFEQFVAPLQLAMGMMEVQLQTLRIQEMSIQEILSRQLSVQQALPTTARNLCLFQTEEKINGIVESMQKMRHEHLTTLRDLDQSAQTVLQYSPPYRERVLSMILEARELSQSVITKLEQIDQVIDLKMTELVNAV